MSCDHSDKQINWALNILELKKELQVYRLLNPFCLDRVDDGVAERISVGQTAKRNGTNVQNCDD